MTSGLIYSHRSLRTKNEARNRRSNIQTKVSGRPTR